MISALANVLSNGVDGPPEAGMGLHNRRPEIRAGLHGASRHVAAGATCSLWKLAHVGRNIDYQPVPETRASGGVGIVAGNSEALCSWRRV